MAVGGHLLLLIPVLSLCGATEYYVRPTEPTDTSCPGQPCLTLSQYSNDSDHYFKSNTVFKFLPGIHHIDKHIQFKNVQNMSLESSSDQSDQYPHVEVKFNSDLEVCNCDSIYDYSCAAINFNDVSDVVLKGMTVTVHTPNISGIVFWNVSNISVQSTTIYSLSSNTCAFGVVVFQAETVQVNLVSVYKFRIGFVLERSRNISITQTNAKYNSQNGMYFQIIKNIRITSTTTAHNGLSGIFSYGINDMCINKTNTMHNKKDGIYLKQVKNAHIIQTIAAYNDRVGIFLLEANNTRIINTTSMYNNQSGIYVKSMNKTLILNTKLLSNGGSGIFLSSLNNTFILNTTANYNGYDGIMISTTKNTLISATKAMNNILHGLTIQNMNNTKIINTITGHNGIAGILLYAALNTTLSNIIAVNNGGNGIDLQIMNNTRLTNIAAISSNSSGINILDMNNTQIVNVTAAYNKHGVFLNLTKNTNFCSIYVLHNVMEGMMLFTANNTNITALTAKHNKGNGMSVYLSQNTYIIAANVVKNNGSIVYLNLYSLKVGLFFQRNVQILLRSSIKTIIHNSSFININPPTSASTTKPSTLPAIIALYRSTLEISECSFKQNQISAVRAHESNITLSGNVVFSNNTAVSGTAFILVQGSIINLVKNSIAKFKNNYATNTGGVFYIDANDYVYLGDTFSHRKCFLNIPVNRSQIQFEFVNNSAGMGGDILYGGQIAFALERNSNCLDSFENISNVTHYQNDLSLISSNPSRVCFCNKGKINCSVLAIVATNANNLVYLYPGQTIKIQVVPVGQNFGTVAGSVYAQYLKNSPTDNLLELDVSQKIQSVGQRGCSWLNYTIYSPKNKSEVILVLTTQETIVSIANIQGFFTDYTKALLQEFYHTPRIEPMLYSNVAVYINISILSCPAGFQLTTNPPFKCDCNQLLKQVPGIHCHIRDQTFRRSGLVWVGMTQDDNGINGTVAASQYCPLNYCNKKDSNVTLINPDSQCNYNHSGILCGACQPGLSLALGSNRCLPCSNKFLALVIPFILAGPALVGFIKFLDLTVAHGTTNGLIFYANIIQANHYIFLPWKSTHILSVFIAWINLDLGVETCFFKGLNVYYKTWLQFTFPFYIWSIAGLIIIFSKYSSRVAKLMGNNSVPVLATLFLLSYAKLFRIIITTLSYTILHTSDGRKAVWSADGNMDYMGIKHMLLFVVAVASLLFLWLPYTLILFLGQWLHMCNCRLIVRFLFKIKPFLDAHYAPLKDRHRYWFGFLHLVRAAVLLVSALIPTDHSSIITISVLTSAVLLTFVGIVVYKNTQVSLLNMGFFLNLILISGSSFYTQIVGGNPVAYAYTLIGLAFLQYFGLIFFKIFLILQKSSKVKACFHLCIRQKNENNWELLEQEAILRERESESEEEVTESSGSMESLTTI